MIASIINDAAYAQIVPSWAIITGGIWFVIVSALMIRLTVVGKAHPR